MVLALTLLFQTGKVQMSSSHQEDQGMVFLRYKHENILMVDLDLPSRYVLTVESPNEGEDLSPMRKPKDAPSCKHHEE